MADATYGEGIAPQGAFGVQEKMFMSCPYLTLAWCREKEYIFLIYNCDSVCALAKGPAAIVC